MAKKDRVGEVFVSNEGYEMVIVEYNSCYDVWVEFLDEHKARVNTTYSNCKSGQIKNPYHPSVHKHGYLGLMSDGTRPKTRENGKATREYSVWSNMLQRVYDPKYHEKYPTYKGVILEDCLHCFAYFLEFVIRNIPNERISLDKDIRGDGVKVYSRDTIMFVSNSENVGERNERYGNPRQPTKVYGVNVKTGERTKVFENILEVERELGVNQGNISKCLKGEYGYKTSGGYKWYKVE